MTGNFTATFLARLNGHSGRRATGLALALALEALLVLMLLTLGKTSRSSQQSIQSTLTTFNIGPDPTPEEEQSSDAPQEAKPLQKPQPAPTPPDKEEPKPAVVLPSLIPMSPDVLAATDISKIPERPRPPAPAKRAMGPSAAGVPGDTPLMAGTGPNGEPLYAAQWYREPTDGELAGYLSTASGPGWGLIACKTEPEYRVDQCVIIGEYPAGSRIANAVLQASWQFRVRPPRKGGRTLIGEWVGIRIDYGIRRP